MAVPGPLRDKPSELIDLGRFGKFFKKTSIKNFPLGFFEAIDIGRERPRDSGAVVHDNVLVNKRR